MIKFPKKSAIIAASLIATSLLTASFIKASENKELSKYSIQEETKPFKAIKANLDPELADKSESIYELENESTSDQRTVVININIFMNSEEGSSKLDKNEPI